MSPWVYPLCSRVIWAAAGATFRLAGAALVELMVDAHAFSRTLPLPITPMRLAASRLMRDAQAWPREPSTPWREAQQFLSSCGGAVAAPATDATAKPLRFRNLHWHRRGNRFWSSSRFAVGCSGTVRL